MGFRPRVPYTPPRLGRDNKNMSLFAELRRRNVIRVGAAYCVAAWIVAQVAEFAFENFGAPDWVLKSLTVVLLLGLPLALIFAWAFELTPEGIKRERDVPRDESITPQTGRKLDRVIIGILAVAVAWFAWDKFAPGPDDEPVAASPPAEAAAPDVLPAPADKSVAVLPFVAMSSGPDDEYFADGLTEEILNSLAQLPELLVTARTSAFSFKGQDLPVQQIAEALNVQHVVEGSVRRAGDRVRVTAQLIRAGDAFHLWSQNYDSTSADTITVQEDIAEQIAAALDVVLDEGKREAMRQAGLRDVAAFTLFQKGLDYFDRAHGEVGIMVGLNQANEYFDQVIARVPDYAPAYVAHSDLYVHKLADDASFGDAATLTDDEVQAALDTILADYRNAERYAKTPAMRAMTEFDLAYVGGNWRGITGRLERALASEGCYDGNWTSLVSYPFGLAEQHLGNAQRMLACDPRRSLSWFNVSRAHLRTGQPEEALRIAREGTDIAPGAWLYLALVRALVANGQYAEALDVISNDISDPLAAKVLRAMVAAHRGDDEAYRAAADIALADPELGAYWWLIISAWGGQLDDANAYAQQIDRHAFSPVVFTQVLQWCACGAPWDLDTTPNFAAKVREGGIPWPPVQPMSYPNKDW